MKPLLYNALKSLLLRLLLSTRLSFSLKLHISPLSGGKKAVVLQQISQFPPPQHQRWLEGEAHFPVSKVSQLTKNVSFPLDIRSHLTELRNFLNSQPVDGQEERRRGGRESSKEQWAAELARPGNLQSSFLYRRQKESQLRSRKLDTTALRYSLNRVMLEPHELHIVPPLYEFWQHWGRNFTERSSTLTLLLKLIGASTEPLDRIGQPLIRALKYLVGKSAVMCCGVWENPYCYTDALAEIHKSAMK